ncbi:MAG: hypothetical protein QNJ71_05885 [Acidimicrobiia bacterium]|nr:hypothetical protein [Acidimicrobiia bacterium]
MTFLRIGDEGSAASERGSMLPLLGGLMFVTFVVLAVAVDVARLHTAHVELGLAADVAAEAGAAMIDELAAHRGDILLDEARATDAASAAAGAGLAVSESTVDGGTICVTLTGEHRTTALTFVGIGVVSVSGRSCAQAVAG